MSQPAASPYLADALEANRAGVLTEEQRRILRAGFRNRRGNTLATAAMVAVLGVVVLLDRSALARPELGGLLAVAAFAVATGLVLGWRGAFSRLLRDVRDGRVQTIEGAIGKEVVNHSAGARIGGFAVIGGRRFPMGFGTLEALPDAGYVRLYYLPRSLRVVNLERLPDRALPADALAAPAELLRTLTKASLALNTTTRAEARATLAGIASAMAQAIPPAGSPPPPYEGDPGQLAAAILGNWRGGAFSLAFARDGTATVKPPLGEALRGRWSVDAGGRLHIDALGGAEAVDARVAGDSLTVVFQGSAYTFQRV